MKKQLFLTIALFWCSLLSFGQIFTYNNVKYTVTSPTTAAVANHSGSFSGQAIIYDSVYDGVNWYSVTNLEVGAFENCTGLTSVTIPNSVTSIGNNSFRNSGLASVTIPDSVTSIGISSFYGCTSLASVTIPNSVNSIGNSAFRECSSLTSITIPNSVISIGNGAFLNCTNLTSITIPNSVTSIGFSAFESCTSLTSITIPNSVTSISGSAFKNCSGLTSVNFPSSLASIGSYAFQYCTNLTSLTFPNSLTSFGLSAFGYCSGLTSINIPNSVTSMGTSSFSNCTNLTSVTVNWATPLTIFSSVFTGVPFATAKLYVPAGTASLYSNTAVWSNFIIISQLSATQSQTNVSCNGASNGSASVQPSGGTGVYNILWSNGATSATATGLSPGNYSCTISATALTSIVKNFIITEPTALPDNITTETTCDSYTWNGTTYTQSGIYTGTTTNCVTEKLNLTITPSTNNFTTETTCDSFTWNSTTYT